VPVFNGVTDYTRRGDFQVNANGNLINGVGIIYGRCGRSQDRKPARERSAGSAVSEQFCPGAGDHCDSYSANLPTIPTTPASAAALAGTLTGGGRPEPGRFRPESANIGHPGDTFRRLKRKRRHRSEPAVTAGPDHAATLLSGAAGTDSLQTGFSVNDTDHRRHGRSQQILTFKAPAPLWAPTKSTSMTTSARCSPRSTPLWRHWCRFSSIVRQRRRGHAAHGRTERSNRLRPRPPRAPAQAAFAALGFANHCTAARTGGGTVGTGLVVGNDIATFDSESISGGAVTAFNASGTPVNLQLRWAKTDSASLGSPHLDTWNFFIRPIRTQPVPRPPGSMPAPTSPSTPTELCRVHRAPPYDPKCKR